MEGRNTFIGICTQNELVVSPTALKPTLWGNDQRKVAVGDLQAKTSDWIIQEIGLAKGRGMELILLVEKGLRTPGGLQGNIEHIEFERDRPQLAFGKITEMIRALSPKSPGAPVASDPPATKDELQPSPLEYLAPKSEWNLEEYKRNAFRAYLRGEEDALAKIGIVHPLRFGEFYRRLAAAKVGVIRSKWQLRCLNENSRRLFVLIIMRVSSS
jgi:hypothetical protein